MNAIERTNPQRSLLTKTEVRLDDESYLHGKRQDRGMSHVSECNKLIERILKEFIRSMQETGKRMDNASIDKNRLEEGLASITKKEGET